MLYYHICLNTRRGFFLKSWQLNLWGLKFAYEVPNQIALNQTTKLQTKACITKLSCEICAVLRYYVVQSGNSSLMFQDKGRKIQKREQSTSEVNFFGTCPLSNVLKKHSFSEAGSSSIFRQRTMDHWSESFSVTKHHRNMLKYVP